MTRSRLAPMRPRPAPSPRPWAGQRLDPEGGVGELWVAGPASTVHTGDGMATLDDLAGRWAEDLVGTRGMALLGPRFPLLVKLIDAADWLSLQVHPDDTLAAELTGGRELGKTEAWLVLDATPGAELVIGPRPGLGHDDLLAAIDDGTLGRPGCEIAAAVPGEALLLRAGTMHAIGAGTLVYEIEQPSDLTYRISDWGRPGVPGRRLHPAESRRAIRPAQRAERVGSDWTLEGAVLEVPQFRLEIEHGGARVTRRPAGRSLEVLTVVSGAAVVAGDGWREGLRPWDTLVVPASDPGYALDGTDDAVICVGSIP